ncbi:glycosyltransferase family 2 protein [Roseibacterium sp. SDUM158017]|uniref:glycosyltransferase family 2 protein n=1 Tax=Roseicyclus salinarum TaxID=3036773 RepID=UPI002414F77D|nr:glycosyltransferase family 2 protein [Roseibacterium sp. SDUM158017]MDG4648500.1 glycosyltransferase family 2 protein [Roseibacterium sp. SDUM158017]
MSRRARASLAGEDASGFYPGMGQRITALTMMRDEAPSLLEWIAFQEVVGFDRIVVYTNDCRDGTDAMLDRLARIGVPVLRRDNPVPPGGKPQPSALKAAQKDRAVLETDWLMVLDADEFVSVKVGGRRLPDLIAAVPEGTEGIVITWRIMGSCGLTDWDPGLVLESYTRGAPDDFRRGWGVKTLFRPFSDMRLGIHRPTLKGAGTDPARAARLAAFDWVNGSGRPMTRQFMEGMWRSSAVTLGYSLVELAHFAVKSREAFLLRQLRGNVNAKHDKYDAVYFGIFDRNETERGDLLGHLPAVRDRVARYLRDPALAALHRNGRAWHAAQLRRLAAEPGHARRMEALAACAAVPYDALDGLVFTQPLDARGKAVVARLRGEGVPDPEIARRVAASVSRLEAARDARDARELRARGLPQDR